MRRASIIASLLQISLVSWPAPLRAELSDAALTTLEIAADVERLRGLKLAKVPETVSMPWASLQAEARRVKLPLDPRPALEADLSLYQTLGVLPPGEKGLRAVRDAGWPVTRAAHFPGDGGGRLVIGSGASASAHAMAVGLAVLDERFGLGSLAPEENRDRQLAGGSLALGDAALFWLSRAGAANDGADLESRLGSCRARLSEALGLGGARDFVHRLIEARFLVGLEAAMSIRDRSPWGVIDELYRNGLPRSTAQVLHPATMIQDQRPRELSATRLETLAGYGAPAVGVLGELRLALWLETWIDAAVARRAATGWAGDVYHLYPPPPATAAAQPSRPPPPPPAALAALVAFDDAGEPAVDEAGDFAGAVAVALENQAAGNGRPAETPPGEVKRWVDAQGLAAAVEQREDKVLVLLRCPAGAVDRVRGEVWERWSVGRVDLSALVDETVEPPPPIPPPPPIEPWYRRTPGYVAAVLWLGVVLPLFSFLTARRANMNPVTIYLYSFAATIALLVVGWFLRL